MKLIYKIENKLKESTMKTFLTIILMLLVFEGELFSTPANPDSGLVAFYPLNGNANNAVGSSGHGTIVGAYFVPDRFNQSNSAISGIMSNN
jgi:hypothetical protein